MILSVPKKNNYLSELISLEVLSRGDWDQSGLFSPILKRKWEGARRFEVSEGKHPLAVCTRPTPLLSGWFSLQAAVSPRLEGCPQLRRQEACLHQPHFLSFLPCAVFPCSCALQLSAACSRQQHPAHRAEPSKGTWQGVPATWRIGNGLRGRALEAAAESGLLIAGGTSNQFHASGVSCL